jgi:hypothetical protein
MVIDKLLQLVHKADSLLDGHFDFGPSDKYFNRYSK